MPTGTVEVEDPAESNMGDSVDIYRQDVLMACILLGLIALVGVLGNLMMVRALIFFKDLRTDFFILLGSVSIADTLCLVIAVPRHIIDLIMAAGPVTDFWCKSSK